MAKTYVLCIGGTGSRILQSLVTLLTAGVKCNDEIVPLIIDLDSENGDTEVAFKMIESYNSIRYRLYGDDTNPIGGLKFFCTKISPFAENQNISNNTIKCMDNPSIRFCEYIGYADADDRILLNEELSNTRSFIESIFDNSKPDNQNKPTELFLNLKKGFKGRPNIGSVVFDGIRDRPEFSDLISKIALDPSNKIFIISSIFGGTGSSGFPQIMKIIENAPKPEPVGFNLAGINNIPIGALSVFPYFSLKTPGEGQDTSISSTDFMNKAKSALYYYENNMKRVDRMYNLYDDRKRQYENNSGGKEQNNDAHWIELMGAYAIINFVNNCNTRPRNTDNSYKQETYAYFPNGEEIVDFGRLEQLEYKNFYTDTQNDILKPLIKLSIMWYLIDKIIPSMKEEEVYYYTIRNDSSLPYKFLYRDSSNTNNDSISSYFEKYISTWFSEIQRSPRGLKLVNFDANDLRSLVGHKADMLSNENILKDHDKLLNLLTNVLDALGIKNKEVDLSRDRTIIMKFVETCVEDIFNIIEK
jgi:hypothetical protein